MRGILNTYLVFDGLLILFSLYMGGVWLLNTQIAFIGSMLVVFSSFLGYKNLVQNTQISLSEEDFEHEDKDIIKKTKKSISTFKSTFSLFRLFAYGFLVVSFLWLNRHEMLQIQAFLIGLSILPIGSLFLAFKKNKTTFS